MGFIEFGNIRYFFLGIGFIFFALVLYFLKLSKKKKISSKLSTMSILSQIKKNASKKEIIMNFFLLFGIFFLFFALADPQMRLENEKEGVNIVLVIDSSGSMTAADFKPNRMGSAKKSAIQFIDELEINDNVGVVSFSDSTRIVSFLTNDKDKVSNKVISISATGGTAIGDGLAMGVDMVTSISNKKKLIILLSDGEQTAGQISIDDALEYAKIEEIVVYTIGVGSLEPVILGRDWFGRPQYARLDEVSLKKIALETGGEYFRAIDDLSLEKIYESLPDKIKKEKELQSIKDYVIEFVLVLLIMIFVVKFWKKIKVW